MTTPSYFDVRIVVEAGSPVVRVSGELDIHTAPALRVCLGDLVDSGERRIVVDLTELDFMDSTGVATLVGAFRRVRGDGGSMTLRHPKPTISRALDLLGMRTLFDIVDEG